MSTTDEASPPQWSELEDEDGYSSPAPWDLETPEALAMLLGELHIRVLFKRAEKKSRTRALNEMNDNIIASLIDEVKEKSHLFNRTTTASCNLMWNRFLKTLELLNETRSDK